jgi:centromeric protein E
MLFCLKTLSSSVTVSTFDNCNLKYPIMDKRIQIHLRIKAGSKSIWSMSENTVFYTVGNKKVEFDAFDSVFYMENTAEIYEKTVKSAMLKFKQGENVTVFAYGQTGSGKTHTIIGNEEKGFIKIALDDIMPENLNISFIELFNEKIYDLFTQNELKMYTVNGKTIISGLHSEMVSNDKEALHLIEKCMENRKCGETRFNLNSSRSHAILQIKSEKAILTFIDLAGSERACEDIKRMKEASYINRSLLSLGTVVNNLLNNKAIGFRDSKLTRLLQDTLTTKTNLMVFCMIGSTHECLSESLSTLNFAARLANLDLKANETSIIENKANNENIDFYKINEFQNNKIVEIQQQRIQDLEKMLIRVLDEIKSESLSDIFILEKQMYKIKYENAVNKTENGT